MARKLTTEEIEYIIDFIKPQGGIPPKTAISIANKHKKKLTSQLNEIDLGFFVALNNSSNLATPVTTVLSVSPALLKVFKVD